MKKIFITLLKITYWLSFAWCFVAGLICGDPFTGAALSIVAALHCAIAFVYIILDKKINTTIRTLREENDSLRKDVGVLIDRSGISL